jgi:DNA-binding MarR family transcriptional regulator
MSNPSAKPLTAAELMRQLGFRFPAAPALQAAEASRAPAPRYEMSSMSSAKALRSSEQRRTLHVTNGDVAAETIRLSGVPGEVSVTADVLHEGPAPGGVPPERWRKIRARYLAESGYDDYESCLATLTRWDHTLEDYRSYDEVVLWFEHDLFDQLLLVRTLDLYAARNLGATELSLICVGEYLGEFTPQQMSALLPRKQRVNQGQKLLARDVWKAFCAPDPTALEELRRGDTSPLPYLSGALRRHLQEFPSVWNGLSRSEHQILRALAQAGEASFEEVFRATQRMEERIYMGDASFHRILRELASPPRPLVRLEPAANGSVRSMKVSLTTGGREVLEGKDDWIQIRGVDRWLGGVHLQGREAAWRWDTEAGHLVAR